MKAATLHRDEAFILAALAGCLAWPALRVCGVHVPEPGVPILAGAAVLFASFLLSWAGEAAEMEVPHGVAITALALVAVLPEYAVDMYFAWRAGNDPSYAAYAAANMTGANRLLIGVGWAAVLFAAWWARGQRKLEVDTASAPDFVALLAATAYSFILPLKGTLSLFDCAVFIAIFAWCTSRLWRSESHDLELAGPARVVAQLRRPARRAAILALFALAAGAIYLSAAPFAEGLVREGKRLGIDEFHLVQWVAPMASEAPEFIVAVLFALKGRGKAGLRMLISSKVNQWTLLIGMLPAVFALSSRSTAGLPLDPRQGHELLLTSAQSLFALAALADGSFSWAEAAALLALFALQPAFSSLRARGVFSAIYVAGAVALALWKVGRPIGRARDRRPASPNTRT